MAPNDVVWNIGYSDDMSVFAEVLHWAWRASMDETLLLTIADPAQSKDLASRFSDDWGDAEYNERSLLPDYDPICARAFDGNFVRIVSMKATESTISDAFCIADPD